jgi:hypothetical protein
VPVMRCPLPAVSGDSGLAARAPDGLWRRGQLGEDCTTNGPRGSREKQHKCVGTGVYVER